jgi:ABC-type transport system involved in multi-copper enzyme maturation permease subunit
MAVSCFSLGHTNRGKGKYRLKPIGIIAGLTIKEALRRKVFIISILVAIIFTLLSLIPLLMGWSFRLVGPSEKKMFFPVMLTIFLGLPMIRFFSTLLSVLLASNTLSGEIERGSLMVILPRPISRSQIYLGKWLGLLAILTINVVIWSGLLWSSLYIQLRYSYPEIFYAAAVLLIYPLLFCTLTLFFSSFCGPILSSGLALLCGGIAWSEGALVIIGNMPLVHLPFLVHLGHACAWVVPISHTDRWVDRALGQLSPASIAVMMHRIPDKLTSSSDLIYIALWSLTFLLLGQFIFYKRDI